MIDLSTEAIFPLKEADFPSRRRGKRINYSTLWRWAMRGVRGTQLETVRLGATLYTSAAAIQRFAEALSDPPAHPGARAPRPRTPTARRRASERAERDLNLICI